MILESQGEFEMLRVSPEEPLVVHCHDERREAVLVFAHGLGGSRYGCRSTWGKFPKWLFDDFPDLAIGMYQYRTLFSRLRFSRSVPVSDEARLASEQLRALVEDHGFKRVVLAGHSMGGLLLKGAIKVLIDNNQLDTLASLTGLILMATPQAGSLRVPRLVARLSHDLCALEPHSDFVRATADTFTNRICCDSAAVRRPDTFLIPVFALEGSYDRWVDPLSSGLDIPASRRRLVRGSHKSIVKPRERTSDGYLAAAEWIRFALNDENRESKAQKRLAQGDALFQKEDFLGATRRYYSALEAADEAGDKIGCATAHYSIGECQRRTSIFDDARISYGSASTAASLAGSDELQGNSLLGLADLCRARSEDDAAQRHLNGALDLFQRADSPLGTARANRCLAELLRYSNPDSAKTLFEKAAATFEELRDAGRQAICVRGLGDIARIKARYREAAEFYEEALRLAESAISKSSEASVRLSLADLARKQGDFEEARDQLRRATTLYRIIGQRIGEAQAFNCLAEVERENENSREAEEAYSLARGLYRQINVPLGEANVLYGLGGLSAHRGEIKEARRRLERASELYSRVQNPLGEANARLALGEMLLLHRRPDDARRNLESARRKYVVAKEPRGEGHATAALGRLEILEGRVAKARDLIAAAHRLHADSNDEQGVAYREVEKAGLELLSHDPGGCNTSLERAERRLRGHDLAGLDDEISRMRARLAWYSGDLEGARGHYEAALERVDPAGAADVRAEFALLLAQMDTEAASLRRCEAALLFRNMGMTGMASSLEEGGEGWLPVGWPASFLSRLRQGP